MLNYSLNFPLSILVLGWELVLCEGRHREGGMSRFVEVSRLEGLSQFATVGEGWVWSNASVCPNG